MPVSPEGPKSKKAKTAISEEMLASRLASSLDAGMSPDAAPTVPEEALAMPMPVEPSPPKTSLERARAHAKVEHTPSHLFDVGVERLTDAVASAQELARDTAQSLADSRLQAAQSFVTFQRKILEMVHAHLNEGFAAAQKIMTAPSMGEAIKVQRNFASERVRALTGQAAELGSLSAKLAHEAQQPWAAQVAKSFARVRSSLSA